LLNPRRKPMVLNRFDPLRQGINFAEIDAMVDMLWAETTIEFPMEFARPYGEAGGMGAPC